uniref:Uncharacterized protein n=1 Tax=Sulfolobus neozealandicus TaxID=299422 RepID=Q5DVE8_9CREN|nr:hypothetical protein [Sulfolobus neozealandicus]
MKDQLSALGFKYSKSSHDYYRVLIDEQKENELLQHLQSQFAINIHALDKEKVEQTISSLEKILQDKYKATFAHPKSSFCKVNVPVDFFLLLKYFQIHINRKCFMPIPNRFPSRILVDGKILKEILSFDEFLEYNPIVVTNDSSLYLHIEIFKNLLKDVQVIVANNKDILDFIGQNFVVVAEYVPQVFVSSFRKSTQVFIFVQQTQAAQTQ